MQYVRVRVDLRSTPATATKSVPFNALATHYGVRQCGLKLRVAPGSLSRNKQGVLSSELSEGHIHLCAWCVCVCVTVIHLPCSRLPAITQIYKCSYLPTVANITNLDFSKIFLIIDSLHLHTFPLIQIPIMIWITVHLK